MDLGTGIFLSAIFLGGVALYIATKDRWNWKKVILWPLGVVTALAVIGGLITYGYIKFEERPKKLTEFWGVSLSDTVTDVKFKKGRTVDQVFPDFFAHFPNGSSSDGATYFIKLNNDRVKAVLCSGNTYYCASLHGVNTYDSLSDVEKKLGSPSFVSRTNDELTRAYSFEKFNIVVEFSEGKMQALGIYDPAMGHYEFSETAPPKTSHLVEVPDTATPPKK